MGVDIFGVQGSPPCRAVYLVAKAIGLDYTFNKVDMQAGQHRSPEFLKMNPAHTVPTMKDGDLCLGESKAIITYLMNKYAPDSELYPKDPAERAKVDQRLHFDSGLFSSIRGIVFPVLFNKDLEEFKKNKPKLDENLDLLETFLGRSQNVAGERVTVADLAVLANVSTVQAAGLLEKDKWPRISAWLTRLQTQLPYYSVNVEGANMLGEAVKKGIAELGA
ncbi:glutathione S-transferase 1-1-like [Amphibalanus amphitrite]|uniref:glutathione S-transferase 1-1-like n=1 Tax=Amphibalanus amphitrite TaxID=1232801 RepID=UPI001C8FD0C9|nr:glutathione S-transferase 1-1-like [Amphibalanus amphitrite]